MICPYCNDEMQKGYIQSRDGVFWTPKKHVTSAVTSFFKDAIAIGMDDKFVPNGKAIEYHCAKCKTVIIPYGEEKDLTSRKKVEDYEAMY